jgi:hypothetical protein
MSILFEILKRPIGDIAIIFGCLACLLTLVGTIVFVILRAVANLFGKLHIKKIGIGGIECNPEPKRRIFHKRTPKK